MRNELRYYKPLLFGEMLVFTRGLCSESDDLSPVCVSPNKFTSYQKIYDF